MGSRENLDFLITKSKSNEKSMENVIGAQAKSHHNIEKIENTITSVAKQVHVLWLPPCTRGCTRLLCRRWLISVACSSRCKTSCAAHKQPR